MGILDLFRPKPKTPVIIPILPDLARQEILNGRLPILNTDKVFLKRGEKCHYIDKAIYEKRTVRKRYVRRGHTYKGKYINWNDGQTDQVDNVQYSTHRGILYLTNRRMIFVGEHEGFDERIENIIAVQPYSNCIEIQFSKAQYKIFVPDGNLVHAVLKLVK